MVHVLRIQMYTNICTRVYQYMLCVRLCLLCDFDRVPALNDSRWGLFRLAASLLPRVRGITVAIAGARVDVRPGRGAGRARWLRKVVHSGYHRCLRFQTNTSNEDDNRLVGLICVVFFVCF